MNNQEIRKLLISFLKENGILREYVREVRRRYEGDSASEIIDEIISTYGMRHLVDCAFSWGKSTSGHAYWSKLNEAWRDYTTLKSKMI
jgi:hypothetical protein